MRFLLVNQFYPPDMAPTGQHLHDLARCLAGRGHEVEVVCSRRSYDGGGEYPAEGRLDGVRVRRLPTFGFGRRGAARAADYASFHAAFLGAGRRLGSFDLTLSLTTPPYVGWTVSRVLGRRAGARAHWVMDIYPDVLAAHGGLRAEGPVYRAFQALTRRQFAGSALVLTLGPRMMARLSPYVPAETPLAWVPLWGAPGLSPASEASSRAHRERSGWKDECVFLYSGNMGLGHRLDEFLAAAARTDARSAVWAFAGSGRRLDEVRSAARAAPGARIEVLPYVPQKELAGSLGAADVHLVSLRCGWEGLILPSKLQAAFASGRPVIFVGPADNEAADWVSASGGGWRAGEGDVEAVIVAAGEARDPGERRRRGEAALRFAREHFDRERNTHRIADLLEGAIRPSRR